MTRLLNTDEARLAVWQAIEAITIGNATDDKLIVANLAKGGIYLATQPATSQEGEGVWAALDDRATVACDAECNGDLGLHDAGCQRATALLNARKDALVATPTPPTLSEDLREAVWRAFVLVDHFAGEGLIYHCEDGSRLAADVAAQEICTAVGIELEDGWPRIAAARVGAQPARLIKLARQNLALTQGCMECNAEDERRWADTIRWLEENA